MGMVEVRGVEPLRSGFRGPPLHRDTPTEEARAGIEPVSPPLRGGRLAIHPPGLGSKEGRHRKQPQRAVSTPVRICRLVPGEGCRPSFLLSHPRCPQHNPLLDRLSYMPPHKTRHFCFNRYFWCKAVLSMTSIEEGESRRIRWRKAFAPTEGRRL